MQQRDDGEFEREKQQKYFFKTLFLVLLVGAISIFHQVNLVLATPQPSSTVNSRRSLEAKPRNHAVPVATKAPVEDASRRNIPENNTRLPRAQPRLSENESCRRNCHPQDKHYNIIILDHYEQAGLGDRLFVFRRLAILAGYLCAKLYVPPPYTMLATFHNSDQNLPTNLTWVEMEDIRFRDDNSSVLVPYELDPVDEHHGIDQAFHLNEYFRDDKHSGWLRLRFNDHGNFNKLGRVFRNQVKKLDEFVTEQHDKPLKKGFIWEVYPVLYHYYDAYNKWKLETIGETKAKSCQYTKNFKSTTTSNHVKDRVLELLQQQYPHTSYFVPLHIRRGDTTDVCDTSLTTMKEFLECSFFDNDTRRAGENITVLLATDEQDVCYRRAILSMIEALGHKSVDLEEAVWDVLRAFAGTRNTQLLNNMFVYKVISDLRDDERIGAVLEKRRDQCPECQSLAALLPPETETKKTSAGVLQSHSSDGTTRPADSSGRKIDLQEIRKAYDLCTKEESVVT